MASWEKIKSLAESTCYCPCEHCEPTFHTSHPFLTISRQTGAGGHALAEEVLSQITALRGPSFQNWGMFDKEFYEIIAQDPHFHVSMRSLLSSEYHSEMEDIFEELFVGMTPQDKVVKEIFRIIRALASSGRVILVGHGAACLTRDMSGGIHVRLVASLDSRIERMCRLLKLDSKEAKVLIQEQDQARAKLVKTYFNQDIEDPLLYDVVWNTDTVSMSVIAGILIDFLRRRQSQNNWEFIGKYPRSQLQGGVLWSPSNVR